MIPLELTLTDFRSYRGPETIDFRGLRRACIIGQNGAGKSTIITAMLWALYGKSQVPKNGDLVRRGADSAVVELTFEADGQLYRIEREVKASGSTKARLFHVDDGEEIITEGVRNVSGWIDNNLRLNYDTTINASVILQGKSDRFSTMTPAERKQFLSEVLGLSICEKIASLARSRMRDFETRADMKTSEIERFDEQLTELTDAPSQLKTAETEVQKAVEEEKEANKTLAEIRERKSAIDGVINEIKFLEERERAANRDIAETKAVIEEARNRRVALKKLIDRADEIEAGWEKLQKLREEREKLNAAKSRKLELLGEISNIESEIERWRKDIEMEIGRLRESRKGIAGQIADIDKFLSQEEAIRKRYAELLDARKAFDSLEKSREEAGAIAKRIDALNVEIEKQKTAIDSTLKEKRNTLSQMKLEDVGRLENELMQIGSELEKLPKLREKRDALKEEGTVANARIESLSAEVGQIENIIVEEKEKIALLKKGQSSNCPLCGQSLDEAHREKVIDDIHIEIEVKEKRLAEIGSEVKSLESRRKGLRNQYRELDAEIKNLEKLTEKRAESKSRIENAIALKAQYESLQREITELEKRLNEEDFATEVRMEIARMQEKLDAKKIPDELYETARKRVEKLSDSEFQVKRIAEEKEKKADLKDRALGIEKEIEKLNIKLESGEEIADKKTRLESLQKELDSIIFDSEQLNQTENEIKVCGKFEEEYIALKAARKDDEELANRIEMHQEKLADIEEKVASYRTRIEEKRDGLPSIESLAEELEKAEDIYCEASERHRAAAVEFSQAKARVETLEKLKTQKSSAKSEKKKFDSEARLHRLLGEAMGKNGVPAFVIANALPEIEREADRLLSLLTGDEMSLKLNTSKGEKDNDTLEVHITTPTGESGYENFSGGEAFRLDFALRVALSRFLARGGGGISTLIIDEGFGTQDDEGLALLAEALRAIEEEFDLILTITHLERFKEEFDQVIEVTKTPGEGSIAKVYA